MREKVTVIVPIYNTEKYLKKCVESLVKQTYCNLEIILVNDGSKDNSGSICDACAKEDSRITVIHKENGGLMSAWAAGILKSSAEYICFVDSDDWIEKTMIAEMIKYTSPGKQEIICCNFIIERKGRSEERKHQLPPGIYEDEVLRKKVLVNLLGNENRTISLSRCMKLISRELIENNMHYCNSNIKMGEDVNIMLPAILDAKRIVVMKDSYFYHYLYNPISMVHAYDSGLYQNIRELFQIMKQIMKDKQVENGEEQAKKEYIYLLMLALKNEIKGKRESYVVNIKQICKQENTPDLLKTYHLTIREKGNQLPYMIMKHPNSVIIRVFRWVWHQQKLYQGGKKGETVN